MAPPPRRRAVERANDLRARKERESRLAAAMKADMAEKFPEPAAEAGPFEPAAEELLAPRVEIPELSFAAEEAVIMDAPPVPQPTLAALALEINTRLDRADRMDQVGGEHRLAAAIRLAEAQKACAASHQNFKRWAQDHIRQSKRTVSLLLQVGKAPDPRAALDELRAKNALNNQVHRERKKLLQSEQQARLAGPAQVTAPVEQQAPTEAAPPTYPRPVTVESLLADYAKLPPSEQHEFLRRVPHPKEEAA